MEPVLSKHFEPSPWGRRLLWLGLVLYLLFLLAVCFLPQKTYPEFKGTETPGIIHIGRLVFLPLPFNSLFHWEAIKSQGDAVWITLQNISNIFLLYPLVFLLLCLFEKWRSPKASLVLGLSMSLAIEFTQLLLDLFFDFNRVVETDDLITNTLGAYLAYLSYRGLQAFYQRTRSS